MTLDFLDLPSCTIPAPIGRIPCLRARGQAALGQQYSGAARLRGCGHCVTCNSQQGSTGTENEGVRSPLCSTYEDLWPSGFQSPTVYFYVRASQLLFQASIACSAAGRRHGVWRQQTHVPSALLKRRLLPPLQVLLPNSFTNVKEGDTVVLLGQVIVSLAPGRAGPLFAPSPQQGAVPASATPAALGNSSWPPLGTPPVEPAGCGGGARAGGALWEAASSGSGASGCSSFSFAPPAKRTRLSCSPAPPVRHPLHQPAGVLGPQLGSACRAPLPLQQQQQQQQQQQVQQWLPFAAGPPWLECSSSSSASALLLPCSIVASLPMPGPLNWSIAQRRRNLAGTAVAME